MGGAQGAAGALLRAARSGAPGIARCRKLAPRAVASVAAGALPALGVHISCLACLAAS